MVMAVALTGCHSSKHGMTGNVKENAEAKAQYEAFVAQTLDFDQLQAKVKFTLGSKSLSGKLTVEQGKRLCMTMTVFGAEVARLEANREEVYIAEKLDKVYAKLSIAEVAANLGLQDEACYEALEALVLGRIFIPGKGCAKPAHFKHLLWSAAETEGAVVGTYKGKGYTLDYTIDGNNTLCQTQVTVPAKEAVFEWNYANYQQVEEKGSLPGTEKLHGAVGAKDMTVQFSVSNPQLGKKGISAFNPAGYKEVTFDELLTMIKNLR